MDSNKQKIQSSGVRYPMFDMEDAIKLVDIIDKKGKIAHLTRLFNMEEFSTMVEKIKVLLKDDGG